MISHQSDRSQESASIFASSRKSVSVGRTDYSGAGLLESAMRNQRLIALVTALCLTAVFIYILTATPVFTSTSRILVEQNGPQILSNQLLTRNTANYLHTQAQLIRSTPILTTAIEQTGAREMKTFADVDNLVAFLKKELGTPVGKTDDIISVSLDSSHAQEAAKLVNGVVAAYVAHHANQRRSTASEVLRILNSEKEKRDLEMKKRRTALSEFRNAHPTLMMEDNRGMVVTQQFAKLSSELTDVKLKLLDAKNAYEVAAELYKNPDKHAQLVDASLSKDFTIKDDQLSRAISNLEVQYAVISKTYPDEHHRVKSIRAVREDLLERRRSEYTQIAKSYVDALHYEYEMLVNKESQLRLSFEQQQNLAGQINADLTQYAMLQEALDRTEKLSDILDDRIKELNVTENAGALNIWVLEYAQAEDQPTSPRKARILAIGLLAGVMLGFGLALLKEGLDQRLRSAEETAMILDTPVIGVVPHMNHIYDPNQRGRIVETDPRCEIAEAYRSLRTEIYFGLPDHQARTILITSPAPQDGKSTTACNLAIAMAKAGRRVLLIDADLRKPTIHRIFSLKAESGLSDVLNKQANLEDVVTAIDIENLSILPCGSIPPNPSEMLNSDAFKQVLETLAGRYEHVIIDSPPVMAVTDARILGALCQITLLVLRADKSIRKAGVEARRGLLSVGAKVLGLIINDAPSGGSRYGYPAYGYQCAGANGLHNERRSAKGESFASMSRENVES